MKASDIFSFAILLVVSLCFGALSAFAGELTNGSPRPSLKPNRLDVCSPYGDLLYERKQKGEDIYLFFHELAYDSKDDNAGHHIADLMDSDFDIFNELEKKVRMPEHDITKLLRVAPLGDAPLNEFNTFIFPNAKMIPINVFGVPDRAIQRTKSGAFYLDRFSRDIGGVVKPFNIVMVGFSSRMDLEQMDSRLRMMRTHVNLTDGEIARYGVQFAIRDKNACRTLSYAEDGNGRTGMVFTNGTGNFRTAAENSALITSYGETEQRKVWNKLMRRKEKDEFTSQSSTNKNASVNTEKKDTFYLKPDMENVGLVSVIEQDLKMIYRAQDLNLVSIGFKKSGPNTMTFGAVAKECTRRGLSYYDEYEKRGGDTFPVIFDLVMRCLKDSNFKRVSISIISPIRTRLTLTIGNVSKEFYARKFNGSRKGFERYQSLDLLTATNACVGSNSNTFSGVADCLNKKGYQLVATDTIKPREMFHIATREETEQMFKSAPSTEHATIRPVAIGRKAPNREKVKTTNNLKPGRDSYGLMAIDVPAHWYDDTAEYLMKIKSINASKRTTPDPGIKSLLMIKRGNGSGNCKFRELRYLPKEVGYYWGIERLATEVAQILNNVLATYSVNDYLQAGISVPSDKKRPNEQSAYLLLSLN